MTQLSDKTTQYIQALMIPPKKNTILLYEAFNEGRLAASNSSFPMLFSHAKQFLFATIVLGDGGHNSYYSVDTEIVNGTYSFIWKLKNEVDTDLKSYTVDPVTGKIGALMTGSTVKNYIVKNRSWYTESMSVNVGEGIWPTVYAAASTGEPVTSYSMPIQETVNGTTRKIGIVKNNVWLSQLDMFMKQLELVGDGYALILENNGNIIASSSKVSSNQRNSTRSTVYNINNEGITSMATKIKSVLGTGTFKTLTVQTIRIYAGGERLIVRLIPYSLDNLSWTVLLVFKEADLYRSSNIASYATIGVTIIILSIGIITALLNGFLVTKPLINLVREFKKIASMDLEDVQILNSSFTEISIIYSAMDEMTTWLKEFRAFLPESILVKTESELAHLKKDNDTSSSSHSYTHSTESSELGLEFGRRNKFKVGLSGRVGTVLVIAINNVEQFYSLPPNDIVQAYSKLVSQVSAVVNQTHGIMQIVPQNLGIWVYYDRGQQEVNAVQSAMTILQYTEQLSNQLVLEGYPPLKVSCGVHTAPILSGNLAFGHAKVFTLVGTLLSQAEQLQQYCQRMDLKIVIDEVTWNKCRGRFKARAVDIFRINDEDVPIYEILEKDESHADDWVNEIDRKGSNLPSDLNNYSTAIHLVSSSRMFEAKEVFDNYLIQHPTDKPTKSWIQLIQKLENEEELVNVPITYYSKPKLVFSKIINTQEVYLEHYLSIPYYVMEIHILSPQY
jgi:class 3 adenylate cyclase